MNDYSGAEKSEWEERFFGLILDLGESQSERYKKQAIELLRAKTIRVPIKNCIGFYKLDLFDCKFKISHDNGESFVNIGRTRIGWRKQDKLRDLPGFFAHTEASTILDVE